MRSKYLPVNINARIERYVEYRESAKRRAQRRHGAETNVR